MENTDFDALRDHLEKQYENAVYSEKGAWSKLQILDAWAQYSQTHPEEDVILRKTALTELLLAHAPIAVEKWNPFPGKFQHFDLALDEWKRNCAIAEKKVPGVILWGGDMKRGVGWMVDRSHAAPDWKRILKLGITGLIDEAEQGRTIFHQAVRRCFRALQHFCRRIAEINENQVYAEIADHAPQTLHEAFALAFILHDVIEIVQFEEIRTMGRFDELYLDFYRNDLKAGRQTRGSAKELIKFFWIAFYARYQGKRFGKNFCFGPEFNELSYVAMEAYYEMNTVDPKLSVLVTDAMPQDFLELYAKCIRDGRTSIVSLNYNVIVDGLIRHGRTPEDAENFIPIGCYEPAVAGKEISCSGASHLYLPVILLDLLSEGKEYASFDELKADYLRKISENSDYMQKQQILCDEAWKYVNPVPLFSGTFRSCMEKGKDITDAGAVYNTTGNVISYIADAVDSLTAIRYLVYEQKLCSLDELRVILAENWAGHEKLRQIAQVRPPKWGNHDPAADEIAVEIASFCSGKLSSLANGRGGYFFPSLYGQMVVERGRDIGALPSGRKAGMPMSKNLDACIGMDKNGVTGLMGSALNIDMTQFPCGTCLDLMLHPTAVRGKEGIQVLSALIRRFIHAGGSGLQFNIFDAAILRDAQAHPEKYDNLQVRVCGWNVRFNDLEPDAQETFIRQAEAMSV